MNYWISILFRLIPLLMGLICLFLGLNLLGISQQSSAFVAGHVLISLTAICYALFTTASAIIQQLIGSFNRFLMFFWPASGYLAAIVTIVWGFSVLHDSSAADHFVAAHVVIGVGMIAACVSTVAAASGKFTLIPKNAADDAASAVPASAYSALVGRLLIAVPLLLFIIGVAWALSLLTHAASAPHFIAGNVLLGLNLICGSLIALVATVVRQVRNQFGERERWHWGIWVMLMGSLAILVGLYDLMSGDPSVRTPPGIVLIGLGMVCYSISSKVWLLALVWRRTCALADRIPLIPVFTCPFCLFLSAFLIDMLLLDPVYFIPSRVLIGLGAVCFTLFSIVSILEAGTAKK